MLEDATPREIKHYRCFSRTHIIESVSLFVFLSVFSYSQAQAENKGDVIAKTPAKTSLHSVPFNRASTAAQSKVPATLTKVTLLKPSSVKPKSRLSQQMLVPPPPPDMFTGNFYPGAAGFMPMSTPEELRRRKVVLEKEMTDIRTLLSEKELDFKTKTERSKLFQDLLKEGVVSRKEYKVTQDEVSLAKAGLDETVDKLVSTETELKQIKLELDGRQKPVASKKVVKKKLVIAKPKVDSCSNITKPELPKAISAKAPVSTSLQSKAPATISSQGAMPPAGISNQKTLTLPQVVDKHGLPESLDPSTAPLKQMNADAL
jgi:hypothetical protein